MKRITAAVFGAGTMGGVHARNAASLPRVQVKYVCNPVPDGARILAGEVGARWVRDARSVMDDPEVNLVIIAYPTHVRRELIEPALASGKYVFCEKPLASTLAEARQIAELAAKVKTWLSLGMVVRYFWEYQTTREIMKSGRLGRVGMIRTTRACAPPRGCDHWFADYERSGGVILDLALHDVDFLCWTFGRVERVFAKGLRYAKRPEGDYALITLRFESGEIAHVEGSWIEPPGTFYTTLEIACAQGILEYDRRKVRPLVFTRLGSKPGEPPGVVVPEMPELESPYLKELREVVEAIRREGPAPIPASEAMMAIEVADAAFTSIRTGQPVSLGSEEGRKLRLRTPSH